MKTAIGASVLAMLGGCASVAGEKTQPVMVQTILNNSEVAGVGCTLANDAGKWFVTSPGSVVVHKSTGDMSIDCVRDSTIVGHETAVSRSNGAVWGNILIGGGIGYIIDRNTGAGFDYPSTITVVLRRAAELIGVDAVGSAPKGVPAAVQAVAPSGAASAATSASAPA